MTPQISLSLIEELQLSEDQFLIFLVSDSNQLKSISAPIKKTISSSQLKKIFSLTKKGESRPISYNSLLVHLPDWQEPSDDQFINRQFIFQFRQAIQLAQKNQPGNLLIVFLFQPNSTSLKIIIENALLANYKFNRYQSSKEKKIRSIKIILPKRINTKTKQEIVSKSKIVAQAVNFSRDLANIPGQEITPARLVKITQKTFAYLPVKVKVFNWKKLQQLKMGGLLSVGSGSSEKPYLIILEYLGCAKNKKIDLVFVGKGITFDSGGLNLKPSSGMKEMWMDMSGGAAVIGAIRAISQLKIPINVVGLVPAAENMPSGSSYRPGDIINAYNGKTIEIVNTDAEGRVILADALSYGEKKYQPKMIVDVATLTGAAVVALGQRAIALLTDQFEQEKRWRKIGQRSGDFVWPLPTWPEYKEEIKGNFGDLANVGKTRYGGAITAALFLKEFCPRTPWIHLDIAPTMVSIEGQGLAKGSSGSGVRYLIELADEYKQEA